MNYSTCCQGVIFNDVFYYSDVNTNRLVAYNLKDQSVRVLAIFPGEKRTAFCLHKRVLVYDNKLFFFPELGSYIHIYDLVTGETEMINVLIEGYSKKGKTKISGISTRGKLCYIFPQYICQPLFILHMDTLELEIRNEWNTGINKYVSDESKACAINICELGDDVYIALRDTNLLLKTEIKTLHTEVIILDDASAQNYTISVYEDGFYITQTNCGDVLHMDLEGKITRYKSDVAEGNQTIPFAKLMNWQGVKYVLPGNSDWLGKLDDEHQTVVLQEIPYDCLSVNYQEKSMWPRYPEFMCMEDYALIFPMRGDKILRINKEHKVESFYIEVERPSSEVTAKYMKQMKTNKFWENENNDLNDFLELVKGAN